LINFLATHKAELFSRSLEHLVLTSLPLMIVMILGVPLGLYLTRHPRKAQLIVGTLSFLQSLPTLAFLALILTLGATGTHGAVFALTLYCLLPVVSKTFTGITTIDPFALDL